MAEYGRVWEKTCETATSLNSGKVCRAPGYNSIERYICRYHATSQNADQAPIRLNRRSYIPVGGLLPIRIRTDTLSLKGLPAGRHLRLAVQ